MIALIASKPSSVPAGTPAPTSALDASSNPNYPAASAGDRYRVTVAGKVGGASGKVVEVGDIVECIADSAGGTQAAVGSDWIIYQANIEGMTAAGLSMIQAANAAAQIILLGLGSMATQAASAVAITGGTLAGIKSLGMAGDLSSTSWEDTGVRLTTDSGTLTDTSAAGTIAYCSSYRFGSDIIAATNARTFTNYYNVYIDVVTAGANVTITNNWALGVGSLAVGADALCNILGSNGALTTRQAATQDAIRLLGRAGGTSSYSATITTAALTASRTFTIPAVTGNDTFALLGIAQTFTAAQTFTPSGGTSANAATFNGKVVINGDATQDLRLGSAGMFLTNVGNSRIVILDSSTGAAYTLWSDSSLWLNKTTGNIGWRNGATTLYSDANNELDLRSGTNAQTFRAYGTYTDASNYVRLSLSASSTAVAITAETAGTGADDVSLSINSAGAGSITFNVGAIQPLFLGSDGFNATIAFFGATPIMQPTRPGQLTDNSGGTSGGNTIAALTDTGGLADIAPVKDAVATLAAKLNAIEAMLSEAAGGLGLCS